MPSTPIAANSLLAPSTSHSRCCGDVSCDLATVGETKTAIESARNRGADNNLIVISYSSTTEATRCNTRRRDFTLGSAQRFFLGFALSKTMPFPVPGIGSSLLPLPILTAAAFCPMNLDTVTMRAPIFICPVHYYPPQLSNPVSGFRRQPPIFQSVGVDGLRWPDAGNATPAQAGREWPAAAPAKNLSPAAAT